MTDDATQPQEKQAERGRGQHFTEGPEDGFMNEDGSYGRPQQERGGAGAGVDLGKLDNADLLSLWRLQAPRLLRITLALREQLRLAEQERDQWKRDAELAMSSDYNTAQLADQLKADRDRLQRENEGLIQLLSDLRDYTTRVEGALSPWIATRPSMAKMPDGWQDLRPRLAAALDKNKTSEHDV